VIAFLNLIRLVFLFLLLLPCCLFSYEKFIYLFLRSAGPSFIKLGQILSVRSDIVGEKLSKILVSFYDDLTPFSKKNVQKILHNEFGDNFQNTFTEFDFKAVASASIAQVHKAKLSNGKIVAVKILRPRIPQIMARDIASLKLLSFIFSPFSKFLKKFLYDVALLI
jgi:ubiquinone biosynthesis protein